MHSAQRSWSVLVTTSCITPLASLSDACAFKPAPALLLPHNSYTTLSTTTTTATPPPQHHHPQHTMSSLLSLSHAHAAAACSTSLRRPAAVLLHRPPPLAAAAPACRPLSIMAGPRSRLLPVAMAATLDSSGEQQQQQQQQQEKPDAAATPEEQDRAADEARGDDTGLPGGVGEFTVPHDGRAAPMSEVKKSAAEQQGGAPEGDRAIQGQAWQPTKQDGETPADRFGSDEAAAQASEASKDRSRKSDIQTGDMDGDYAKGSA